jgi:hypothetical protein
MLQGRFIAAALLGVVALSSDGGVTYRYSTRSDNALQSRSGGRVWIDGDRKRVELDPDPANPRASDVAITVGGKTTCINLQNRTYFHERPAPAGAASSKLFHLPWPNDRIKGRPTITYRDAGAGPAVGDYPTTRHVVQVSYVVEGALAGVSLKGKVEATVLVLMAPTLGRDDDRKLVRVGFREVDGELTRLFSALEGMVVGSEVSVSRKLDGGPVIRETTTMSVAELKIVKTEDSLFTLPPGLTYQEPVVGVPGL